MKVLLVNPSQAAVYGFAMAQAYPPLGPLYIGAVLEKEGHTVKFFDVDVDGKGKTTALREQVSSFCPDVVGITTVTPTVPAAFEAAAVAKAVSNAPVILGGIHPTMSPRECIENPSVDVVVVGEAEETIVELIAALGSSHHDLSNVKGIWFKENGTVRENPPRLAIKELDSLPFPARHLLSNPKAYCPPDAMAENTTAIITTRGCWGKCTYCCTRNIFGSRIRARSVDNVIAEIDFCVEKLGIREFHIADDCFTYSAKRVLRFCREVQNRWRTGLRFVFFNGIRADQASIKVLRALKSIGVLSVGFGVESGSADILARVKKGYDIEKVRKVYRACKRMGFETWGFFMIGLPGETPGTARETINLAKQLDPDFAKFLILKPFPGSEVYHELAASGLILDYNYDRYGVYTAPVHKLPGMSPREMVYWQKRAYREYYLRPGKILTHLLRPRSLTQVWLNLKASLFVFRRMYG